MITIRLNELEKHRNETTFRPYLQPKVRQLFRDVGIKFVVDESNYDMTWVAQASYIQKTISYSDSTRYGERQIDKIAGDIILFDGQDSPSLMGSWDVFKSNPKCKFLLKNSLYSDRQAYFNPSIHGRIYWGSGSEHDYSLSSDVDFSKIKLTGCNWLSTVTPQWMRYHRVEKDFDVCALFSFPSKENKEYAVLTNQYYDAFRQKCIDNLPKGLKIARLDASGEKLPIQDYYNLMQRSKIIIAPFGYGEIAPRDLEAAMFGSVLIKNDMSHVETIPNVYKPFETYVPCKWDFSDLSEKIEMILSDWNNAQSFYVENFRNEYVNQYKPENLVLHTYNWIKQIEGYGTE